MATNKGPRFETFELLSTDKIENGPDPCHVVTNYAESWIPMGSWYRHSILLSNKDCHELNTDKKVSCGLNYGWRSGSVISCAFIATVLCFNTILVVYSIAKNPPSKDGVGKLKRGPCGPILLASTWSHVAINICSTIVVAASNYNMQCLSAPTRKDIDEAHKTNKYMDIGVHSVSNLLKVPRWKVVLWAALLFSTLPLHLLWNSAIFAVSAVNEYSGLVVAPNFLEDQNLGLNCSDQAMSQYQQASLDNSTGSDTESYTTCWLLSEAKAGRLVKYSREECIKKYEFRLEISSYNLIVVANNDSFSPSASFPANAPYPVLAYFDSMSYPSKLSSWCQNQCPKSWCTPWLGHHLDPCGLEYPDWSTSIKTNTSLWCNADGWYSANTTFPCYAYAANGSIWNPGHFQGSSDWICSTDDVYGGHCSVSNALSPGSQLTILPEKYQIDHCLVSETNFECELQYSSYIFYAVIACNATKFLAIFLHLFLARDPIFATVGDAVASYLNEPDITTNHNCLYTNHNQQFDYYRRAKNWHGLPELAPRIWDLDPKRRLRWGEGASFSQLAFCCCIWIACLALSGILFQQARQLTGLQSILRSGFGASNIGALLATSAFQGGSSASVLTTSLIVNTPQVVFSSLYFMYNSIYTSMASAYEWSLFGSHRKGLRVTVPTGSQRSSYWLQLPWKFSLPLIATSALLHWLVSQSMLMVNIRVQKSTNQALTAPDAYFPMADKSGTVTAISFSPLAVTLVIIFGNLMLICLLGICYLLLKPGITLVGSNSFAISAACHAHPDDNDAAQKPLLWGAVEHQEGSRPGHCCFSSFEVDKPRVGEMYV